MILILRKSLSVLGVEVKLIMRMATMVSQTQATAMKGVFPEQTGRLEIFPELIKITLTEFFLIRRGLESDAC